MIVKTLQDEKHWIGLILSDEENFLAQTKKCKSRKDAHREANKVISKLEKDNVEL